MSSIRRINGVDYPEVVTSEEVAAILRINADKVRKLSASGEIPGRKVGGSWRYRRDALMDLVEGKTTIVKGRCPTCGQPVTHVARRD